MALFRDVTETGTNQGITKLLHKKGFEMKNDSNRASRASYPLPTTRSPWRHGGSRQPGRAPKEIGGSQEALARRVRGGREKAASPAGLPEDSQRGLWRRHGGYRYVPYRAQIKRI